MPISPARPFASSSMFDRRFPWPNIALLAPLIPRSGVLIVRLARS
jgi:hypothetical protein